MESLALLAAVIFLVMLVSGPAALVLTWYGLYGSALFFIALAVVSGLHWFDSLTTSVRYLGLLSALMAFFAFGFVLSRVFP